MSQRAVLFVVLGSFISCFVGSLAAGGLAMWHALETAVAQRPAPEPVTPPEETPPDDAPPQASTEAEPEPEPTPDAPADDAPPAAAFEVPTEAAGQWAVFHLNKPKVDPWKALQAAFKGSKVTLYRDEAPEDAAPPYVVLRVLDTADYGVVEGTPLEHSTLSAALQRALPKAKSVTVLDWKLAPRDGRFLPLCKQVAALVAATDGVLWDEQSQAYFTLATWKKDRLDTWDHGVALGTQFFTVFSDRSDTGTTLTTGGLAHFGLPELRLTRVPESALQPATSLLNALGQSLLEQPATPEPGRYTLQLEALRHRALRDVLVGRCLPNATKEVELTLTGAVSGWAVFYEVDFPGKGAPTARLQTALGTLFGDEDRADPIVHDAALRALSRAQVEFFKAFIKPRFRKGLPAGDTLLVKAPFATASAGTEWMWVEVQTLGAGGRIEGLLANDPDDVPTLEAGAPVVVREAELFDWMIRHADGSAEGNATGKLLEAREGP